MRPSKLILASASPRRQALLAEFNFEFEIKVPDVDEALLPAETANPYVKRLALSKARAVIEEIGTHENCVILAADTAVVMGQQILGKPENENQASQYLALLSGQTHEVLTGVCILKNGEIIHHQVYSSKVTMKELTQVEIRQYIQTGESMDKAGAYAAQGMGKKLIKQIEGSLNNVIGLPIEQLKLTLVQAGIC